MEILSVRNLGVSFSGLVALKDLSFIVATTSITGLIGPNGAGKSTFFNVLSRMIEPDHGEIFFKGENLMKYSSHQIPQRGICRSFQTPEIFRRLTVVENLLLGAHLSFRSGLASCAFCLPKARREEEKKREEAIELLRALDLADFLDKKADNLPLVFQRRMEIGRALLAKPSLLLLDEPTAGMVTEEKENIIEFIRQINQTKKITIIIIEHDIQLIHQLCDYLIVLNFGEKIAEGPPDQVSRNQDVIKAYLGEE
jgi:branched-chain amino acid transport system ATP-binding protein